MRQARRRSTQLASSAHYVRSVQLAPFGRASGAGCDRRLDGPLPWLTGLVFSKLARLARNTKELLEFAEIFKVNGADLISLDEAIDTSSPAGRLFFTMIAAMAQWEREEIAARVSASIPIRAAMGKPTSGSSPFGYRWVDKRLVPDPKEAPVRALLHELFAEHQRKKAVARILNERGYRTRGGKKFGDTTLRRLLDDPTAKGMHRVNYTKRDDRTKSTVAKPESEWVWIDVEPVVSPELWDRCAAILAQQEVSRKPARKVAHLFAGFAHCACGNRMYVFHPSPKYVCTGCRNKIPADDLEAVYRAQLTNFLVEPSEIAAHEAAAREAMSEREKLIASQQKELAKIARDSDDLFDLYSEGALAKADFSHRFKPLSERRAQIEDEVPRMQAEVDVLRINLVTRTEALGEARALSERWTDLPFQEKRQIIEAITDRIVIGKEEVEITLLHIAAEIGTAAVAHGRLEEGDLAPGLRGQAGRLHRRVRRGVVQGQRRHHHVSGGAQPAAGAGRGHRQR
jgi:site-specific DNA recombinase